MSIPHRARVSWLALLLTAAHVRNAVAQECLDWSDDFAPVGTNGYVWNTAVFDDGSGPALYVAGSFLSAGGIVTPRIARWTGSAWQALPGPGGGFAVEIRALTVFDDGSGPRLVAGGNFASIDGVSALGVAAWDGTEWAALGSGTGGHVLELAVFDDGSGPALYASGANMTAAPGIARWDGSTWSSVGPAPALGNGYANRLRVFDDGSGPALYAAGPFNMAGGQPANGLARWDGSSWSSWPGGAVEVWDILVFDDGSGPALYAGGDFTSIGGVPAVDLARWDGVAWTAVGTSLQRIEALGVHDEGGGPRLFAAGLTAPATFGAARWDGGGSWTSMGAPFLVSPTFRSFASFDDGSGQRLYLAGRFHGSGAQGLNNFARWDGAEWSAPQASSHGMNGAVRALAIHDDGSGPRLWAGGGFTTAGDTFSQQLARWGGSGWEPISAPLTGQAVTALGVATVNGSTDLYYGALGQVVRRVGSGWQAIGAPGGDMTALCGYDAGSGEELYAAGSFPTFDGEIVNAIVRWNGTSWSPLAGGVLGTINALTVFDDGSGAKLYAGGAFTSAGGVSTLHLARWDGATWQSIGSLDNHAYSFAVWDDGGGPALYVGGAFATAGGVAASRIAKWTAGGGWSALGSGLDGVVFAMHAYDDGTGPALVVAGNFTAAGGSPASRLARWNGVSWSAFSLDGQTVSGSIAALAVLDDGSGGGPDLWVGGTFAGAGHAPSANIARWEGGIGCPTQAFCFGDGSIGACPCGNSGSADRGCDNSSGTGGALLAAHGTVSPDTLVLDASGELASSLSIFSQGNLALGGPVAFGDGLRCVGGALKRLYSGSASGGAISRPAPGDPSITARSAILGDPIAPGSTRYYYVYYRDPVAGFCPAGGAFNVGNALSVGW